MNVGLDSQMSGNHQYRGFLAAIILTGWLLLALPMPAAWAGPDDLRVVPDAKVQAALEKMDPFVWDDPVEFYRQAYALRETAHQPAQVERLIRQVAYFAAQASDNLQVSRSIVFRRFMDFTEMGETGRVEVVSALAPLVDSPDGIMRRFVTNEVLGGVDLESDEEVDFVPLTLYVAHHPNQFSPALIDIMLRQSPSKAIRAFAGMLLHPDQVTGEELIFADHAVQDVLFRYGFHRLKPEQMNDAVSQLRELLKSKEWWVRRYVAEVLWRHDMFRRPDLVAALMSDPDPRIVQAFSRRKPPEMREP
jgi:hypothetical protein